MKKKVCSLVLSLCSITVMYAADFAVANSDGITIYYNLTPTSATVTSGNEKYSGNVVIPNEITYSEYTLPVISIGNSAFISCNSLTSVTIPDGVTSIGSSAFRLCSGLTSVTIPNGVTRIEESAFWGCTSLTSVTIPDGVTYIGGAAFRDCSVLTSVTIPNGVTNIGLYAFHSCTSLTSVTIPEGVTYIGDAAFSGCSTLTTVNFNATNCTKMGSSEYPVFKSCSALSTVNIGNNVTRIPDYAFYTCSGLTAITIPGSVTSIGMRAFSGCSSLTAITIPNNVTSIGRNAFYGCSVLTAITIPNSVTSIGDNAFQGCTGLTEIHSKNSTPPKTTSSSFTDINKMTCKLYVPIGSRAAYAAADGWKDFFNIIEEEGDATAITPIDKDKILIYSIPNGIAIETKEATPISIFNIAGQKVHQTIVTGSAEIHLSKGVYIVKANNSSRKIIVK